jgi:hypothetical protein
MGRPPQMPPGMPAFPSGPPPGMSVGSDTSEIPDFLRAGPSYIPPSSGFFFGLTTEFPSMEELLPNQAAGDRLISQYFQAVHPIARCVHRQSFEVDYQGFWEDVRHNIEPRPSTQAVVFAAWFSAAVSMDEPVIIRDFGCTKQVVVERLKRGAEVALSKASFLRSTKVETMQGFVMYMVLFAFSIFSFLFSFLFFFKKTKKQKKHQSTIVYLNTIS